MVTVCLLKMADFSQFSGNGRQFGIIPRTLDCIFNRLEERLYKKGNIKPALCKSYESLREKDQQSLLALKERILKEANVVSLRWSM